jgi:hypothetical protein
MLRNQKFASRAEQECAKHPLNTLEYEVQNPEIYSRYVTAFQRLGLDISCKSTISVRLGSIPRTRLPLASPPPDPRNSPSTCVAAASKPTEDATNKATPSSLRDLDYMCASIDLSQPTIDRIPIRNQNQHQHQHQHQNQNEDPNQNQNEEPSALHLPPIVSAKSIPHPMPETTSATPAPGPSERSDSGKVPVPVPGGAGSRSDFTGELQSNGTGRKHNQSAVELHVGSGVSKMSTSLCAIQAEMSSSKKYAYPDVSDPVELKR